MGNREFFTFERPYLEGDELKKDIIECKLMGSRKPRAQPQLPRPDFEGTENYIQWVEISGCQYAISEGELLCLLNLYGEVLAAHHPTQSSICCTPIIF